MRPIPFALLLLGLLVPAAPASAQELDELLSRGQVVLVETDGKGRFKQATAIIHIARPVEEVWAVTQELDKLKDYMPKVIKSDVRPLTATSVEVAQEIEVPGVNTAYTFRYDIDAAKKVMKGTWVKGDLKGSTCEWKMVAVSGGTLFHYTSAIKNFSGLAQSFDDDQQTITVGVNVGTALATAKAVKDRVEKQPQTAQPAAP